MKYILRLTFITALSFGALSCTDLDEEILGDFTGDPDINNFGVGIKNNVNKATPNDGLTSAFSRLLNGTANHNSYFTIQELSSDEAVVTQKGGDWYDGGVLIDLHIHDFKSTNDGINNAWNDTYGAIGVCNDLLDNAGMTAAQIAQLRMLRAYFYWRLVDTYGRVKILVDPALGANVAQSTRAQVFDFIVAELNAAIPDLPAGKSDYGRASQGAANALLARVYLNAEIYKGAPMYTEAIAAADLVINSGIYNLDPDYAKVFAPDNVENPEHILIAAFDESTGSGMNFAQMTLHYPSQLTFKLAQQPWNGYSTLEEFYKSYEASDKRRANNFIVGPQSDVNGNPILDLAFDKEDPDGAPINYTPEVNELFPNGSRQAGARLGKFSFKIGQNPDADNDYPVLRYGEVLLNKAEALARKNGYGDGTALALVNQLRTRAGVAAFSSLSAGTLLAERGRELFQEALRRTDLIRFGAFDDAWWEKPSSAPHKTLFPIPQDQINAAPAGFLLTQNPGY